MIFIFSHKKRFVKLLFSCINVCLERSCCGVWHCHAAVLVFFLSFDDEFVMASLLLKLIGQCCRTQCELSEKFYLLKFKLGILKFFTVNLHKKKC